ncbi:hypothetical protein [Natronosalvus caseinilyticus]|nr:hypothetical protein [Natronosalvus caseinilyticus]
MSRYTTVGLRAGSDVRSRLSLYRDDNDLCSLHDAVEQLLNEAGY